MRCGGIESLRWPYFWFYSSSSSVNASIQDPPERKTWQRLGEGHGKSKQEKGNEKEAGRWITCFSRALKLGALGDGGNALFVICWKIHCSQKHKITHGKKERKTKKETVPC